MPQTEQEKAMFANMKSPLPKGLGKKDLDIDFPEIKLTSTGQPIFQEDILEKTKGALPKQESFQMQRVEELKGLKEKLFSDIIPKITAKVTPILDEVEIEEKISKFEFERIGFPDRLPRPTQTPCNPAVANDVWNRTRIQDRKIILEAGSGTIIDEKDPKIILSLSKTYQELDSPTRNTINQGVAEVGLCRFETTITQQRIT